MTEHYPESVCSNDDWEDEAEEDPSDDEVEFLHRPITLHSKEEAEARLQQMKAWKIPYLHEEFFPDVLVLTKLSKPTSLSVAASIRSSIDRFAERTRQPILASVLLQWVDDFISALVPDPREAEETIAICRGLERSSIF